MISFQVACEFFNTDFKFILPQNLSELFLSFILLFFIYFNKTIVHHIRCGKPESTPNPSLPLRPRTAPWRHNNLLLWRHNRRTWRGAPQWWRGGRGQITGTKTITCQCGRAAMERWEINILTFLLKKNSNYCRLFYKLKLLVVNCAGTERFLSVVIFGFKVKLKLLVWFCAKNSLICIDRVFLLGHK